MEKIKSIVVIVLILLVIITGGAAAYFYWQSREADQNPQSVAQREAKALVTRVSRLIVVPLGEDPTIATVTDPERLKEQAFFANAKKGDKVLIYTNAKKAILYDPVADKIVEVAPLNIGGGATSTPTGVQSL